MCGKPALWRLGGALASPVVGLGTVLTPGRTTLDLAKPNEIAAVLDRLAPELILNSSAYTAVDQAKDGAISHNGESPGAIARWAAARRVPLIHVSTDDVFDGSGTRPWKEGDLSKASVGLPRRKQACRGGCRARRRGPAPRCAAWIYAATGKSFLRTIARLAEEPGGLPRFSGSSLRPGLTRSNRNSTG